MVDETLNHLLSKIVGSSAKATPSPVADRTLEDVAFHDFARYSYFLPPNSVENDQIDGLSTPAVKWIDGLEAAGASSEFLDYIVEILLRLEKAVFRAMREVNPPTSNVAILTQSPFYISPVSVLRPLYEEYESSLRLLIEMDRNTPNLFSYYLFQHVRAGVLSQIYDEIDSLSEVVAEPGESGPRIRFNWVNFTREMHARLGAEDSYKGAHNDDEFIWPFEIFPLNSVNIGITKIFRQRWKLLGHQPGEIIKTIPLGPGQTQKVSVKISKKTKRTTDFETAEEFESSTEGTETTKDSSEVVNQAIHKSDYSASVEGSYGGVVGFGAKLKAEASESHENSTKNTTAALSEVMNKTASRMKRSTKTTISTETEELFEESFSSTVKNPNDEVPLTIQYHMLQHQYEVKTYLQSVKNVIYVAERVPPPHEINEDWVRRNDWIISKALLDSSFQSVLSDLINDEFENDPIDFDDDDNPYIQMMEQAETNFASFEAQGVSNGFSGLSVPDIYAEPQRQFDAYRRAEHERRRANQIRERRRSRLIQHIRDNVLHYCKAIWAQEDAEMRMLRYRKERRQVPLYWQAAFSTEGQSISDFEPTNRTIMVDQLIDDIIPLGFTGNYAVFEVGRSYRPETESYDVKFDAEEGKLIVSIFELLDLERSAFVDETGSKLKDPAFDSFLDEVNLLVEREPSFLSKLTDQEIVRFVRSFPELRPEYIGPNGVLRAANKELSRPVKPREWAEFLFNENATRLVLLDSDNLYASLYIGEGVALEPFKQAHRYIDVLKADEERQAMKLKNERRDLLKEEPSTFDPDVNKVVVVPAGSDGSQVVGGLVGDEPDPDE